MRACVLPPLLRAGFLIASFALSLACPRVAQAQIFGAVGADGSIMLTDRPGNPALHLVVTSSEPAARGARKDNAAAASATMDSAQYSEIIAEASRDARVPPELITAVIVVESGYNPNAVSKKGARGLMQLMPETARRFSAGDILNPRDNVLAGAKYLRFLLDLFRDDVELALAAYNAGENAVIRAGYHIPAYAETQSYVPMVMAHYRRLSGSRSP
ncbi:lytic transglycosylase domain-containing protein [Cupriavidus sp. UME77]|uniref:lytic transglycosylase domain-containing protein n=1 Tax=Cupriavidus sp. UME77 TaxID=1862321 RepID=UPI00160184D5|nr:lytic transglycosylase domain-containing protein [Cupriavidus sp. UME77]MBB1631369.1 lytic transglycosylase [Cupriavidus sp. UME77]